jgi:4-carboxymuconolactone decarboxylase
MSNATAVVPRIVPLEPPYEPAAGSYLEAVTPEGVEPLKLFRTLAVHSELASRMRPLGAGLLGHPQIQPSERELVILRTCALNGAEYEWGVHAAFFNELSQGEIDGTLPGSDYEYEESDALLIALADELHATSTVSAELWGRLTSRWSDVQLIELIAVAGLYRLVSYLVNGLRIEPERWAGRFPR